MVSAAKPSRTPRTILAIAPWLKLGLKSIFENRSQRAALWMHGTFRLQMFVVGQLGAEVVAHRALKHIESLSSET